MIFCAEIGSNHKGIKSLAFEMIRQSALAGADIAKFQLGHKLGHSGPQKMRCFPLLELDDLVKHCEYWDIEFMSSIFSTVAFEMAEKVGQKRYKFPSRRAFARHSDGNYDELLEKIIATGKEVFLSDNSHSKHKNVRNLFLVPEYPLYPDKFRMPPKFMSDGFYGYSTHLHGYADAIIAIARGACYVEKHVTLNKTEESIEDNAFALSFDEFKSMVDIGREIARLL